MSYDDKSWEIFSELFKGQWSSYSKKTELLELVKGDETLAMVISQVSLEPQKWLFTKVPALKGKTPIWCINNGRKEKLKGILMNLPR